MFVISRGHPTATQGCLTLQCWAHWAFLSSAAAAVLMILKFPVLHPTPRPWIKDGCLGYYDPGRLRFLLLKGCFLFPGATPRPTQGCLTTQLLLLQNSYCTATLSARHRGSGQHKARKALGPHWQNLHSRPPNANCLPGRPQTSIIKPSFAV